MIRLTALVFLCAGCATTANARFDAIVLGGSGGLDEGDLTSVLLSRAGRGEWIALDAGTLGSGLHRAMKHGSLVSADATLKQHLHGVFLSHAHLDHVAGLIIVSPEVQKLNVYGLASTLDALHAHVFTSPLWANFTDEGPRAIGRFHLERMRQGIAVELPKPELRVEAMELSHGDTTSTAFLVFAGEDAALYLGDTGPDAVEHGGKLEAVWKRVGPLLRSGTLRAVFIEASFADPRADALLFGHLTPSWILRELDVLAREGALTGLTVIITHIKPGLDDQRVRKTVADQLEPLRARGVRLVIPEAGERLSF